MSFPTSTIIQNNTGDFDLSSTKRISLHNRGFDEIGNVLSECHSCHSLSLAYNNISRIENLSNLKRLKSLDLSFNQLTRLENLSALQSLERIQLEGNNLANLENALAELRQIPSLRSLSFQNPNNKDSNPLCHTPNYLERITDALPRLTTIDGEAVALAKTVADALLDSVHNSSITVELPPSQPWTDENFWKSSTDAPKAAEKQHNALTKSREIVKIELDECQVLSDNAEKILNDTKKFLNELKNCGK
eukprot:g4398.t1